MKKICIALLVAAALFTVASCASQPAVEEPKVDEKVLTPDILEHKGTALGASVPSSYNFV